MGRLTKDPELRQTQGGIAVTSFTLAVDDGFGDNKKTLFIDIVCWRHTAEFVAKWFVKGMMCAVVGKLSVRDWVDKDNQKRRTYEVVAENVYFTEGKKSGEAPRPTPPASDFAELEDDDTGDLPF